MEKVLSKPQNEDEYESDYKHLTKFLSDSYKLYLKQQAKQQKTPSGISKDIINRSNSRQSFQSSLMEKDQFEDILNNPLQSTQSQIQVQLPSKPRQHETTTKLSFKATQLLYEILSDREAYEGQFLSNQTIDNIASLKQENQVNLLEVLKLALIIKTLSPAQTKEYIGQFVHKVMQGEKLLNKQLSLENLGQFFPSKNLVEGLGVDSKETGILDENLGIDRPQNGTLWNGNVKNIDKFQGQEASPPDPVIQQANKLAAQQATFTGNSVYLDVPSFQSSYQQNLVQFHNSSNHQDINVQNASQSQQIGVGHMQTHTSLQKSYNTPQYNTNPNMDEGFNIDTNQNSSMNNFSPSDRQHRALPQRQPSRSMDIRRKSSVGDHKSSNKGFNQKIDELRKENMLKKEDLQRNKSAKKVIAEADIPDYHVGDTLNESKQTEGSKIASMPNFFKRIRNKSGKAKAFNSASMNNSSTNEDSTDVSAQNKYMRENKSALGYKIILPDQTRQESSMSDRNYLGAIQQPQLRKKQSVSRNEFASQSGMHADNSNISGQQNSYQARNILRPFNRVRTFLRTNQSNMDQDGNMSVENQPQITERVHDTNTSIPQNQILEFLQSRKYGGEKAEKQQIDKSMDINPRLINSTQGFHNNNDENIRRNGERNAMSNKNLYKEQIRENEPYNSMDSRPKQKFFSKLFKKSDKSRPSFNY